MTAWRDRGAAATRTLARCLLHLYPPSVHGELRAPLIDGAVHRLGRERRLRGKRGALLRTWLLLAGDTFRNAPPEWLAVFAGAIDTVVSSQTGLWFDLRQVVRRMWRSPASTVTATAVLTLTIGANSAILGIADAVLVRDLPYAHAPELRVVEMWSESTGRSFFFVPNVYLQAIERDVPAIDGIATLETAPPVVATTPAGSVSVPVVSVSRTYFDVLGVVPYLGRFFNVDDGPETSAGIVSYDVWQTWLGGDPDVIGRTVELADLTLDVIGVLPPKFVFPTQSAGSPDLVLLGEEMGDVQGGGTFWPIVRLAAGASEQLAQSQLGQVAALVAERAPANTVGTTPALGNVRSTLYEGAPPILLMLLGASGAVLLLGCANLAGLLVVRANREQPQAGVRSALGASRSRLVRPVLLDALMTAAVASVLAVALASLTFEWMLTSVPTVAYRGAPVGIDARVVVMTVALGMFSGLAFSVVPAWRTGRMEVSTLLRQGGHVRGGRTGLGSTLIMVQVAGSVVLVFAAVAATRALLSLASAPRGFDTTDVALIHARPSDCPGLACQAAYLDWVNALDRTGRFTAVAAGGSVPLIRPNAWAGIATAPDGPPVADVVHVLPGYFDATGIPLLRGRDVTEAEARADAPVALLSAHAAAVLAPGVDPIGATFEDHGGRMRTVIGLVGDAQYLLEGAATPKVYLTPGVEARSLTLVARADRSQASVLVQARDIVASAAPETVVEAVWWGDAVGGLTAFRSARFQSMMLSGFGSLALLLTAVGVYGLVAYVVTSRTREIGIRMALGGSPGAVSRLVLTDSLRAAVIGVLVGLPVTVAPDRLVRLSLLDAGSATASTVALAVVTVFVSAALAAWIPARRAMGIDPMEAQRE